MLLPRAALERWRALANRSDPDPEPARRVVAWLERLAARMPCTGGRLARLLLETGLCALDDLVACARAQLDAGPLTAAPALRFDLGMDLDVLAELAPLDDLADMSTRTCSLDPGDADALHAALARRLLAAGRPADAEAVLARVTWHLTLLTWLEDHAADLEPAARARLFARAADLVESSRLPADYHVGLLADLAALSGDRRWLARACDVLAALPREALAATPDREHPLLSIAAAEARLGDLDGARARVDALPADERWSALARLLPLARDPDRRADLVAALLAARPPDHPWCWLVELAPETSDLALQAIDAIADDAARRDERCAAARHLRGDAARRACADLLADAAALPPGSPAWVTIWESLPDALAATGNADLLDADTLRRAVDTLLITPALDLWPELGPLVPDARVAAVLEHAHAGLQRADHYVTRQRWIDLGLLLLARAPRDAAERWLELAADAAVGTAIDGAPLARLAAWSPAQQRRIVLGRLAAHQHAFLPQLVDLWLEWLDASLPGHCPDWSAWLDPARLARRREAAAPVTLVPADDPDERQRLRAALAAITADDRWPEPDEVVWTFALLARAEGEPGLRAALDGLTDLRARLSPPA